MLEIHAKPPSVITPNRIETEAERRLRKCSNAIIRNVACEFRDGVLFLRGQLPSYYHKQIAQELLMQIAGVTRIDNQIVVINPDPLDVAGLISQRDIAATGVKVVSLHHDISTVTGEAYIVLTLAEPLWYCQLKTQSPRFGDKERIVLVFRASRVIMSE